LEFAKLRDMKAKFFWGVLLSCCLASASGYAQSSETKAAAEALFEQGRKSLDAGKVAEACQQFEKSDQLDPAPGTQLNLASCYEKLGRTASAWATYKRAAATARTRGQNDREKAALDRADQLEAKLSRLTIVVPPAARVDGLRLTRNGQEVEAALFGQAVPVDPGVQSLQATAPGKKAWSASVNVAANGAGQSVSVPPLADDPAAAAAATTTPEPAQPVAPAEPAPLPPAPPPQSDSSTGSGQRVAGLVIAGVGVVGLGVGGVFALSAKSKYDDSKANCLQSDVNLCNAQGVSQRDDARSAGNLATVFGGIGLAAVIGGTVLYFTAPSSSSTARSSKPLAVGASALPHGGALTLGGAW
jgi:hypothetical protein